MMNVKKIGGRKNYGYGRSMWYAARRALAERYGNGRFSTQYTMRARIRLFVGYLKSCGVKEFGQVTQQVIDDYCAHLRTRVEEGDLQVATAVARVSAVNVLMVQLRGDQQCFVRPSSTVGRRTYVRREAPVSAGEDVLRNVIDALCAEGQSRIAATLALCRVLGLRFREASLLRIQSALRSAQRNGRIRVERGCKGGRARTILAGEKGLSVLRFVAGVVGEDECLVPAGWTYIRWSRKCSRTWRPLAKSFGLSPKFSDLRAGFACNLYEEVALAPAPVLTHGRTASRELDRAARQRVAEELGHGRSQISASYVGTTIRRKP